MYDLKQWLKDRLPDGVSFNKNGVVRTIDEAIANALAFWAYKREPHLWAAYDLWDQIASSLAVSELQSETLDGYSYRTYTNEASPGRAEYFKAMAEASEKSGLVADGVAAGAGSFQMVAGRYAHQCSISDENSR